MAIDALSLNDVWAVGYRGGVPDTRTLIEHRGPSGWAVVSTPNGGPGTNFLFAVTNGIGAPMLQAEVLLPDGRRLFAVTNLQIWTTNGGTAFTNDGNTIALYHFDSVDQWLAYRVERGTSTEVDAALQVRARGVLAETPGDLLIREQMRATRYRRRHRI